MTWFQSTLTKRLNHRQGKVGHLFSGRYKSLLVEENDYLTTLINYVHLNPIRGGLHKKGKGLEDYEWSSLRDYVSPKKGRRDFIRVGIGLAHMGYDDTAIGRRRFLEQTTRIAKEEGDLIKEGGLLIQLKRGWLYGSEQFKEQMLERLEGKIRKSEMKNGYAGQQQQDHSEKKARKLLSAGLAYFELENKDLKRLKKGDWRKAVIAARIRRETTVSADWLVDHLHMGTRSTISVALRGLKKDSKKWRLITKFND